MAVSGGKDSLALWQVLTELGYDTLATGHHLDDEAGRLLGNMIRGHQEYMDQQWPVLERLPVGSALEPAPHGQHHEGEKGGAKERLHRG